MSVRAILVLGPGQSLDGKMLLMGDARIKVAYEAYLKQQSAPFVILSGGRKAFIASEAYSMLEHISKHYPEMKKSILLEEFSTDTIQNAFFTKFIHIDPLRIKQLTIVTNAFHMPRVQQIFTHLFDRSYHLEFLEAPNPIVDEKTAINQLLIEEKAMEFNQRYLFTKNTKKNITMVHSLIFNLNHDILLAYKNLFQ